MRLIIFVFIYCCGIPMMAQEQQVASSPQNPTSNVEDFVRSITFWQHSFLKAPSLVPREELEINEILKQYPNPQDFTKQLQKCWNSRNKSWKRVSLEFASMYFSKLSITPKGYKKLKQIAMEDEDNENRLLALQCLSQTHQKRFLPVFYAGLDDEDTNNVAFSLETMVSFAPELQEKTIQRIMDFLEDPREYWNPSAEYMYDQFLPLAECASHALAAISKTNPRVWEEMRKRYVTLETFQHYHETQFIQFLQQLETGIPDLETFWNLLRQSGIRPSPIYPQMERVCGMNWDESSNCVRTSYSEFLIYRDYHHYVPKTFAKIQPDELKWKFLLIQSHIFKVGLLEPKEKECFYILQFGIYNNPALPLFQDFLELQPLDLFIEKHPELKLFPDSQYQEEKASFLNNFEKH